MKADENFFAEAYCFYSNKLLENCKFPGYLKLLNIKKRWAYIEK